MMWLENAAPMRTSTPLPYNGGKIREPLDHIRDLQEVALFIDRMLNDDELDYKNQPATYNFQNYQPYSNYQRHNNVDNIHQVNSFKSWLANFIKPEILLRKHHQYYPEFYNNPSNNKAPSSRRNDVYVKRTLWCHDLENEMFQNERRRRLTNLR